MKIIIDGVFNHVGTQFWAFRDLVKKSAELQIQRLVPGRVIR